MENETFNMAKNHKDEVLLPIKYAKEIIGENKINNLKNHTNESMEDASYVGINTDKPNEISFYLTDKHNRLVVSQKITDMGSGSAWAGEQKNENLTKIIDLKTNEPMSEKINEIVLREQALSNLGLELDSGSKLNDNSNKLKNNQSKLKL